MEPLLVGELSPRRHTLIDLALELAQKSAGFRWSLPASLLSSLADLVRSMNCYYSNLIEGHDTHPADIERALKDDYSKDAKKRDLQLEARAHIAVQRWIDGGGVRAARSLPAPSATSIADSAKSCRTTCSGSKTRQAKSGSGSSPGELRIRDVVIGNHIAISPPAVPRFLKRFEQAYSKLGKTETILATAAAHHRLAWIHPFLDGNGRVARLMSHATLLEALETGAVWSIARGLAHNVEAYKSHLAACRIFAVLCAENAYLIPCNSPYETAVNRRPQHVPVSCPTGPILFAGRLSPAAP